MTLLRTAALLGAAALLLRRRPSLPTATNIRHIARVVDDLPRAEAFYHQALGFTPVDQTPLPAATLGALSLPHHRATTARLDLGAEAIHLVEFNTPGRRYPRHSRSNDLWFQHLAIVVSDIDEAHTRLRSFHGWTPITEQGPRTLPPEAGGVRAFKFRDPDGHPLEFLWFPRGEGRPEWHDENTQTTYLGIDHSAMAIRSTPRSLRFYRRLGFTPGHRNLNRGPAQSALDAIPRARVQVTPLSLPSGPGLELLRYQPPGRSNGSPRPIDLVTDWTSLTVPPGTPTRAIRDPDGHLLLLESGDPA